jgi:hypothetical protein
MLIRASRYIRQFPLEFETGLNASALSLHIDLDRELGIAELAAPAMAGMLPFRITVWWLLGAGGLLQFCSQPCAVDSRSWRAGA